MGRLKEALLLMEYTPDFYLEPTDEELAASAAPYIASRSPKPIPCDPTEEEPFLTGLALFSPPVLARVIEENSEWLQHVPRSTEEILNTLFPVFTMDGHGIVLFANCLNQAVFAAGYCPDKDSINPTWTFPV